MSPMRLREEAMSGTPAAIAELRELLEKATPGHLIDLEALQDGAVNALPALLDAAEENARLRAALAGVQKLWADLTSQELYGVEWLEQIDSQDVKEIHIAGNYVVAALAPHGKKEKP